jgi:hypothetical protein
MKARILIILFIIFLGNTVAAHPIHISVVNLDITPDSGRIDYSVRLFYEDFQTLINYRYNTLLDFGGQSRMTFKEQQSVIDYITGAFRLTDDDAMALKTEFISWKVEDASVWLFFCAQLDEHSKSLNIHNTLMLDLFNDQINYVIYRHSEEETGIEFNKRKTEHGLNL